MDEDLKIKRHSVRTLDSQRAISSRGYMEELSIKTLSMLCTSIRGHGDEKNTRWEEKLYSIFQNYIWLSHNKFAFPKILYICKIFTKVMQ